MLDRRNASPGPKSEHLACQNESCGSIRPPVRSARVRARPEKLDRRPCSLCSGERCGRSSRAPDRVECQLLAFRSRDRAFGPVRALTGSRFAACREPLDPSHRPHMRFDSERDERLPDPNPKPRAFSGGVFLRRAPSATPNLRASQVPTALPRPFRTRVRSQRAVHAKPQPRPRKSHPLRMTGSSSVRRRRPAPRQTYPQPSVPDKLSAALLHLVVARRAKSARSPPSRSRNDGSPIGSKPRHAPRE